MIHQQPGQKTMPTNRQARERKRKEKGRKRNRESKRNYLTILNET
jgi:hypothetical protein